MVPPPRSPNGCRVASVQAGSYVKHQISRLWLGLKGARIPVMVHIHGGGFTGGNGNADNSPGCRTSSS
jgi:acetyl esterase/lipase